MKFFIKTYGCQMNVRDTEAVRSLLQRHGHVAVASEDEADLVVVNTCSVRGKAEDKALGKLSLLVAGRRERPARIVGVIGCMAQRMGAGLLKRVPGLDFAVGTHRIASLPSVINLVREGRGPYADVAEEDADLDLLQGHADGAASAFVNILLGCDRFCAYCVVPHVRGRERSRPAADILAEIRALAARGVREVTLLGQSVMSYGRANAVWPDTHVSPMGLREPLPRLLEAASAIEGLARIRFTTGHPSGCTEELARAMAGLPAVCEHLHLPLQSGSDRILQRMRRGYSTDGYRHAAGRLRKAVPGLALTTDLIVGFPGETPEDFEATRQFCGEMEFDNAFIFKYSPRPNTPAAEWDDTVTAEEKLRRNKVLLADQDRQSLTLHAGLVGRVVEVLVEGVSLRNPHRWSGRTRTNKIVIFERAAAMNAGMLARVRIERVMAQTLYGTVAA